MSLGIKPKQKQTHAYNFTCINYPPIQNVYALETVYFMFDVVVTNKTALTGYIKRSSFDTRIFSYQYKIWSGNFNMEVHTHTHTVDLWKKIHKHIFVEQ